MPNFLTELKSNTLISLKTDFDADGIGTDTVIDFHHSNSAIDVNTHFFQRRDGRTGILTRTPEDWFHIKMPTSGAILVSGATSVTTGFNIKDDTTSKVWQIDRKSATSYLTIRHTDTDNIITAQTTGEVGFGVAVATHKVQVAIPSSDSGATIVHFGTGTYGVEILNPAGGGWEPFIRFLPQEANDASGLQARIEVADDSGTIPVMVFDSGRLAAAVTTRPLFDFRNFGTSQMIMDKDGNIGLGTTSILAGRMDIRKSGESFIYHQAFSNSSSNAPGLVFVKSRSDVVGTYTVTQSGDLLSRILFEGVDTGGNRRDAVKIEINQPDTAGASFVPGEIIYTTINSSGASKNFAMNKDGWFGAGTSSPDSAIHVVHDASGQIRSEAVTAFSHGFTLKDTTTTKEWRMDRLSTTSSLTFRHTDFATGIMVLTPAGKVGINLAAPASEDLQVLAASGTSHTFGLGTGGNGYFVATFNDANGITSLTNNNIVNGSFAISGKGNELVRIDAVNRRVGINDNTPEAALHSREVTALGGTLGNVQLVTQFEVNTDGGNALKERTWAVRNANGGDWLSTSHHNAISIDGSFATPGTDTKTWWERDPELGIHTWGNAAVTFATLNSVGFGVGIVPTELFHALSTTGVPKIKIESSGGGSDPGIVLTDGSTTYNMFVDSSDAFVDFTNSAFKYRFDITTSAGLVHFNTGTPHEVWIAEQGLRIGVNTSTSTVWIQSPSAGEDVLFDIRSFIGTTDPGSAIFFNLYGGDSSHNDAFGFGGDVDIDVRGGDASGTTSGVGGAVIVDLLGGSSVTAAPGAVTVNMTAGNATGAASGGVAIANLTGGNAGTGDTIGGSSTFTVLGGNGGSGGASDGGNAQITIKSGSGNEDNGISILKFDSGTGFTTTITQNLARLLIQTDDEVRWELPPDEVFLIANIGVAPTTQVQISLESDVSSGTITDRIAIDLLDSVGAGSVTISNVFRFASTSSDFLASGAPTATTVRYILVNVGGALYKIKLDSEA